MEKMFKMQGQKQTQPTMIEKKSLNHLPVLVVENILSYFTYHELLQFRLISPYWNSIIEEYLRQANDMFSANLIEYNVQWVAVRECIEDFTQPVSTELCSSSLPKRNRSVPRMSPRYHHSACRVGDSMYVFGGCKSPSTAYNDLWRLDLTTKKWHRIIAAGSLPLPRLFSSFTYYEDCDQSTGTKKHYIVLFGGILFDEKFDIKERLLHTVHLFDIDQNRWLLVSIEGDVLLKAGNHSAVIIGDELIIFSGIRMLADRELDSSEIFVFDLKKHYWTQQKASIGVRWSPFARTTLDWYRNPANLKRKQVQMPFVLDNHHILYIGTCNTNLLYIGAYLLKRSACSSNSNHVLCCSKENNDHKDSSTGAQADWEWIQVDIPKIGDDFEFSQGGEFCKVGNLLVYLTGKNVAVTVPNASTLVPLAGSKPREHIPYLNRQLLRERRIEALDHYKKQLELRAGENGHLLRPVQHRSTLQLRLLDISKVINEHRIDKIRCQHEMDYTVSPDALSCYSLVPSEQALILFGGHVIDQQKEEEMVSNRLYFLVARPRPTRLK